MYSHYMKVAFRSIQRRKLHSAINVLSLTLGLACCMLVLIWVQSELGYDSFHQNADQLYLVAQSDIDATSPRSALTQEPLAPAVKSELPEVIDAIRYSPGGEKLIRHQDRRFQDDIVARADPSFFETFSFPLAVGDPASVLIDPAAAVISQSMAVKYFGKSDPVGQSLSIDGLDYVISGVMFDLPEKSTMKFDCLLSFESRSQWLKDNTNNWNTSAYNTYLRLSDRASVEQATQKLNGILSSHVDEVKNKLYLVPFQDIHLFGQSLSYSRAGVGVQYLLFFSITAFVILLVGCINFANLTTARSSSRSPEIGVRKVIGAKRSEIAKQFLIESVIMAVLASVLALALVELVMPWFSLLIGKQLSLGSLFSFEWCLGLVVLVGLTGLVAGGYPAGILSSFNPAQVLKGFSGSRRNSSFSRRILVVAQFGFCILATIGVITIYQQLNYMKGQKLGFEKSNMLTVWSRGEFHNQYHNLKNELLAMEGVEAVTGGTPPMNLSWATEDLDWEGKAPDNQIVAGVYKVDFNYLQTMGIDIVAGRDFSPEYATDISEAYILNEAAVREIGLTDPIGKRFSCDGREGRIIGVVNDFDFQSFHSEISPLVMQPATSGLEALCVRINPGYAESIVSHLEKRWLDLSPEYPYFFEFLDDVVDDHYKLERRMGTILTWAAGMGIMIASLGLLGLASFTAQARTKEIGIRKTLGASVTSLVRLLCREFVVLVVIANAIAWPLGYWGASSWLENFAYRIDLGMSAFVLSGGLALSLALFTVSFQAIKAARANPVESLRHE